MLDRSESEQQRRRKQSSAAAGAPAAGFYDVRARMIQLTPRCAELLVKCQWEGHDVPCGQIFSTRLTSEGYCCSFNNVRPTNVLRVTE